MTLFTPQGLPEPLSTIWEAARTDGLVYGGDITAADAWHLFSRGLASLVDVRSAEELLLFGEVPHSINIPWQKGPDRIPNTRFLQQLQKQYSRNTPLLFLCCCGKRSVAAAQAAVTAGFQYVFCVLEGFEGSHEHCLARGKGGWRQSGMPWVS
jgi:rhodanese-related sulfurtransferase